MSISDKAAVNNIICLFFVFFIVLEMLKENDQKCVKGVSHQKTSMCCRAVLSLRLSPPVPHDVIVLVGAAVNHLR